MNDSRGKDLTDWKEHFSSAVQYPIRSWLEFGATRTESGINTHGACLYCKKKVQIPAEVPLLQAPQQCGGRRRNSVGTEGNQWRAEQPTVARLPTSLSWAPCPDSLLPVGGGGRIDFPPPMAPPLRNPLPETALANRQTIISRWKRNGDASFPLISFNWGGNLSGRVTKVDERCLSGVDVDFSLSNICAVAKLGDCLNEISGESRVSARHIRNIVLEKREHLITGLRCWRSKAPELAGQVIDYHSMGVIPVYRGGAPPTPRVRGFPYKPKQSLEIMEKLRKDVRQGRISVCATKSISDYDQLVCTPPTLVTKKLPDRTLSTEMRLISDARLVDNFRHKEDYPQCANPSLSDLATTIEYLDRCFPGFPRGVTKRDVNDAFKRVAPHPYCVGILRTEFPGQELGWISILFLCGWLSRSCGLLRRVISKHVPAWSLLSTVFAARSLR